MLSKRMMFKKLRNWFEVCYNDPLRLSATSFRDLMLLMFEAEDYSDEELKEVMLKLGFKERRIKGTFYIRPTLCFYLDAQKKYLPLNIFLHKKQKSV